MGSRLAVFLLSESLRRWSRKFWQQQKQVEAWYEANPSGSVSKCARDLGISRPTARKWMPEEIKLQRLQAEKDKLQEQLPAEPSKQEQIAEILKQPGKVKQIIKVLKN